VNLVTTGHVASAFTGIFERPRKTSIHP